MTKRLCNSKLSARPFACQVGMGCPCPSPPSRSQGTEHVILCPHWKRWRPTTKIQRCHKGRISSLPPSFPSPTFSPTPYIFTLVFQSNPRDRTHPFNPRPLRIASTTSLRVCHIHSSIRSSRQFRRQSRPPSHVAPETRVLPVPSAPTSPLNRLFVSPTSATLAAHIQNGAHETQQ